MVANKIDVYGKVQGVFFRANVLAKAKELKINGTVKNMPDGHVEIMAEGDADKLESLIKWCNKGPILAKVDRVVVNECEFLGFKEFSIT
ncbi:MAG: acylphosphatase [Bacteroidia bacterium]